MFDWLTDGIVSFVVGVFNGLSSNVDALVTLAGQSPSTFNSEIWEIVKSFNTTAVLPVAYTLFSCFVLADFVQILKRQDAKGLEAMHMIVVVIFKLVLGQAVLANIPYILDSIFEIASTIVKNGGMSITSSTISTSAVSDALENEGTLSLLAIWFQCMLIEGVNNICWILCEIIIKLRYIEIFAFAALAALPLSTITSSSHEISSIGYGFIKRMAALALQVIFIMVVFLFYVKMIQGESFMIEGSQVTLVLWSYIGYSILLAIALFQTGAWSKALCGTH